MRKSGKPTKNHALRATENGHTMSHNRKRQYSPFEWGKGATLGSYAARAFIAKLAAAALIVLTVTAALIHTYL
jgi:hypothetical protein